MISRRKLLASAPLAAAAFAVLPSVAKADAPEVDGELTVVVPRGVPVAVHDSRLIWADPDPARSEIHFGHRWPDCFIVETESPFRDYRVFKGIRA